MLRLLLLSALILFLLPAQAQTERRNLTKLNLLSEAYPQVVLPEILLQKQDWHPFPKHSERADWESLNSPLRRSYLIRAEAALDYDWAPLPATTFLEFAQNGNRSNFQEIRSQRREALMHLVLGECMDGRGRYMQAIVNGIWAICEESYWGVPAHLYLQEAGPGLPDVEEPTIDLFAAETAALLAWTEYLLSEQLDEISPMITKRLAYEFEKRIFEPFQYRDDFWWMGFDRSRQVNNWNPWINSNILTASLLHLKDEKKKSSIVHKSLRSLDNFLNPYPQDGGCDEGPSYWSRAAGSLFDCLEILYDASAGQINVYDDTLVQKMGAYIYKMYIHDDYFVNFADASAVTNIPEDIVYRYGKRIDDSNMMSMGAFKGGRRNLEEDAPISDRSIGRHLYAIFNRKDLEEYYNFFANTTPYVSEAWFPDLQVMTARSQVGSQEGLFVAAQGGHNAESHNHNDVGNFIVYVDGRPAIIDVGVEEYTAKTFSPQRYDIWTMQSAYHNLPTINGMMQMPGKDFRAEHVSYEASPYEVVFSLDIDKAYPKEAGIKHWKREIRFDRDTWVQITDDYELTKVNGAMQYTLMTAFTVEEVAQGKIRLVDTNGSTETNAFIYFDPAKFSLLTETIEITDRRLLKSWPETIHRMLFTAKNPAKKDQWQFTIAEDEQVEEYFLK
jgi:hypothetical protein